MKKKINLILIIGMVIITIYIAMFDFRADRILTYLLLIPTLLLPELFKNRKVTDLDITIYYIFLLIVQVLGCICNFYNLIWWYDLFAHFLSGIFAFYIGLTILNNFNLNKTTSPIFKIFFSICFSALVAASWEIIEYIADFVLGLDVQHNLDTGVTDTMEDMIIAMIGSLLGSVYYKIKKIGIKEKK